MFVKCGPSGAKLKAAKDEPLKMAKSSCDDVIYRANDVVKQIMCLCIFII